uniref:Uncharacterized protein n=1 Tax=Cupriavidus pinatubonensis (strain JMP 134 / LMG 1197) TaxID=264198 RepID=Q46X35_CUPPJ
MRSIASPSKGGITRHQSMTNPARINGRLKARLVRQKQKPHELHPFTCWKQVFAIAVERATTRKPGNALKRVTSEEYSQFLKMSFGRSRHIDHD